jgi:hypothetical protein
MECVSKFQFPFADVADIFFVRLFIDVVVLFLRFDTIIGCACRLLTPTVPTSSSFLYYYRCIHPILSRSCSP